MFPSLSSEKVWDIKNAETFISDDEMRIFV